MVGNGHESSTRELVNLKTERSWRQSLLDCYLHKRHTSIEVSVSVFVSWRRICASARGRDPISATSCPSHVSSTHALHNAADSKLSSAHQHSIVCKVNIATHSQEFRQLRDIASSRYGVSGSRRVRCEISSDDLVVT